MVVLSKKKADFLRVWELIRDAYENDRPVKGLLTRKIKGGVTVDIMGVDAFLPGSQIALRRVPNIEDLIGDRYDFKIIKLNKRRRNIVVSRRIILEAGAREEALDARQGAAQGSGARRGGEEHHRLRRLHRPGRARRAPSHHRHVLGACEPPLRSGQGGGPAGRQGPRHRLGPRTHLSWAQAASALSVDRHRGPLSRRRTRGRQGGLDHELRRVHRAAEGRRGTGSHFRDVMDAECAPPLQARVHRRRDRGGGPEGGSEGGEDLPRHEADRGKTRGSPFSRNTPPAHA